MILYGKGCIKYEYDTLQLEREIEREIKAKARAGKEAATEAAKAQATGRKASSRLALYNSNSH